MYKKPLHIVALSGGKDSTAMALRLAEVQPRDYTYICTPTGDELPEMKAHWSKLESLLGAKILYLRHKLDLNGLIDFYKALPNWRMRWCTRQLKIEVAQAFYLQHPGSTVYVGLRADEPNRDGGLYGECVAKNSYPLREWGWGVKSVMEYLVKVNVNIPKRTDCARCYYQRLGEWFILWRDYPSIFQDAIRQEELYGHTFRSTSRDTWPADLSTLGLRFTAGDIPRGVTGLDEETDHSRCRTCSL